MRISDWSSDVCSSDLAPLHQVADLHVAGHHLAVAQHVAAAAVIADPATGFAHQQDAGGDIPRLESGFEIGIGAATSDIGHVERGRPAAVDIFGVFEQAAHTVQLRANARTFARRSEEHTSELQSLMRISYAVFCLKKKKTNTHQ